MERMIVNSYWAQVTTVYVERNMSVITGFYNHLNKETKASKVLGIHWNNFPLSNKILSPCVIPKGARNAMLSGLLHQVTVDGDEEQIVTITNAIKFFN
ncbi:MAG: hypothetical protein ACJAWL_000962 [Motiliproteus sp.]|jgi:hypothetical protein